MERHDDHDREKEIVILTSRTLFLISFVAFFLTFGCDVAKKTKQDDFSGASGADAAAAEGREDGGAPNPNDQATEIEAGDKSPGELFFDENIVGFVRSSTEPRCQDCHAQPEELRGAGIQGPLAIFEYPHMREKLFDGTGPIDNYIVKKMSGLIIHSGGRICSPTSPELCDLLNQWWNVEMGIEGATGSPGAPGNSTGEPKRLLGEVSITGEVKGVANSGGADELTVRLYWYDNANQRVLVGEQAANKKVRVGVNFYDRGFSFQLPAAMIDGNERRVEAFVVDGANELPLENSPLTYIAFTPRGAGNVQGYGNLNLPNGCGGCHNSFPYNSLWQKLSFPTPKKGGTATNNNLYLMTVPGNTRSAGHSGGVLTNSRAGTIQWWCEEFDPQNQTAECQ